MIKGITHTQATAAVRELFVNNGLTGAFLVCGCSCVVCRARTSAMLEPTHFVIKAYVAPDRSMEPEFLQITCGIEPNTTLERILTGIQALINCQFPREEPHFGVYLTVRKAMDRFERAWRRADEIVARLMQNPYVLV